MSAPSRRVAFLLRTGSLGGAEIQALRAARALEARGARVVVVTLPRSWVAVKAARSGLECRELALGPIAPSALDDVELVHVHEPRDLVWALLARGRGQRPVVVTRHLAASARRRRDPYHRWVSSHARFVAASQFVRGSLVAAYGLAPEAIHVVPYGYPAPALGDGWDAHRAARATSRIGMLSRLSHGKHLDDALGVLEQVRRRGIAAELVIAGEETDAGARVALLRRARERGVAGRLRLFGYRADVAALLDGFDVLLHTAHAESFGLAILEAMAHGCPVVASAGGGVPEIVRHETSGWLAPAGDVTALADGVVGCLVDRASAISRAAVARAEATARFSPVAEADGLLRLYRELLDGGVASGRRARIATRRDAGSSPTRVTSISASGGSKRSRG